MKVFKFRSFLTEALCGLCQVTCPKFQGNKMKKRELFFISFYRIVFKQDKKTYEVYVRNVNDESIIGFLEIEKIMFSKFIKANKMEKTFKKEFKDADRIYIPVHAISRIDEISVRNIDEESTKKRNNVLHIPFIYC